MIWGNKLLTPYWHYNLLLLYPDFGATKSLYNFHKTHINIAWRVVGCGMINIKGALHLLWLRNILMWPISFDVIWANCIISVQWHPNDQRIITHVNWAQVSYIKYCFTWVLSCSLQISIRALSSNSCFLYRFLQVFYFAVHTKLWNSRLIFVKENCSPRNKKYFFKASTWVKYFTVNQIISQLKMFFKLQTIETA